MSIERSQGKRRPRTPRPGESPLPEGALIAEPLRDGKGHFLPGNKAQRLKILKRASKQLVGLVPEKVVPWLRPYVLLANKDAGRLVEELGLVGDTSLMRLAEDTAAAHAVFRGLLQLGSAGDMAALAEAKAWLREHRQSVLSLRAEAREHARTRDPVSAGMTPAQSAIIAERHARRAQAALDASDGPRVDPSPENASDGNVTQQRPLSEDEPPRAVRIHEGEDIRPVRVAAKVQKESDQRDIERAERKFGVDGTPVSHLRIDGITASARATPDTEVAPIVSPEERARIATIERNQLLGLCPHAMNAKSCPVCVMAEQMKALTARHAQRRGLK